jgi:hypothetical protein
MLVSLLRWPQYSGCIRTRGSMASARRRVLCPLQPAAPGTAHAGAFQFTFPSQPLICDPLLPGAIAPHYRSSLTPRSRHVRPDPGPLWHSARRSSASGVSIPRRCVAQSLATHRRPLRPSPEPLVRRASATDPISFMLHVKRALNDGSVFFIAHFEPGRYPRQVLTRP